MNDGSTLGVEFRRGDGYVYRFTVGEHLLISLHARSEETLYALTPTGALLWERLSEWSSSDDLVSALLEQYDVPREQAAVDVREFLEQLEQLKAVETREELG